ncbi:ATP-binding protein [Dasania marina]|uniref:two-component system sensor histidine kinase NtrB n=1 Tax=Dasania marina TaxID=471499 RepID=UPI0030DBB115|tara:strand:+ start:19601 stop:20998 length:1398 start_codon:yes stop_codon:yes gene_type:complete
MTDNRTAMKTHLRRIYTLLLLAFITLSLGAYASPISYFKEDGRTNWQYIANFSSGVLIILLSCTAISLFFSSRKTKKANRQLNDIRAVLEQRVQERTVNLAEASKQLLASETYIKNILSSMPSMLIGLDSQMHITQWNHCAEETTGISADKVLGKNLWAAYPAVTLSQQQIEEVIEEQKPATLKHNQRGQYYFDITIYPLKDHVEAGVVILIDNVTLRSIAENKLIQRDKMSSMGELAASMAHDIDTPLQAIFRDLKSIQQTIHSNDPEIAATLDDAVTRANQASQIIRNLLEFAHSNDRKKRPESLTELIDHTLELAGNAFSDPSGLHFKDINIIKDYQDELPAIPCYKTELQQVFLSLFRHACHAIASSNKDDSPTIKIQLLTCYDSLWLKIQHNGLGLTAKEQHEIFEPFYHDRINPKSTEAENRLSFSQFIIVEHHQGHIFVTSDVDVGTTFHIEFQLPKK